MVQESLKFYLRGKVEKKNKNEYNFNFIASIFQTFQT